MLPSIHPWYLKGWWPPPSYARPPLFASVTPLLLGSVTHISRSLTLNILSSASCRNRVSTQALWKPRVVQGKPGFLDSLIPENTLLPKRYHLLIIQGNAAKVSFPRPFKLLLHSVFSHWFWRSHAPICLKGFCFQQRWWNFLLWHSLCCLHFGFSLHSYKVCTLHMSRVVQSHRGGGIWALHVEWRSSRY